MARNGLLDFTAIRRDTPFEQVLTHYKLSPIGEKPQVKLNCPFHDDKTPSCAVNLTKGIFHCFGCSAKGNVFDFIALIEGYEDNMTFRSAKQALAIIGAEAGDYRQNANAPKAPQKAQEGPETGKTIEPTGKGQKRAEEGKSRVKTDVGHPTSNPVLDLSLKLEFEHEFLTKRGVTQELAESFGLGFCRTGIMKNRIAIPIHNLHGELVAYTGRWALDDSDIPELEGKYKLPKGFEKSLEVFNLHRAKTLGKRFVVIVEGIWSTLRLHNAGIPTVAMLGTSITETQAKQIADAGFNHAIVILDGDEAGRSARPLVLDVLGKHLYVKTINLEEGVMPDTMPDEVVNRLRR